MRVSTYTVLVDENSHYQDEGERYEHGTFATYEEAVAACQRIVDEFVAGRYRPGMTSEELYGPLLDVREDPFIRADGTGPDARSSIFSVWEYARLRCELLCIV